MKLKSRVPSFDIFCGEFDPDAKCVETVEGLAAAIHRMDSIALAKPGLYFVLDRHNLNVVARANSKHRYKPNATNAA